MLKMTTTITTAERGQNNAGDDADTIVLSRTKTSSKNPSLYKVLLMNGDFTPMDFVVQVLERCFNKTREQATAIMLAVHNTGVGVCGVYTYEVAESKAGSATSMARQQQHPLQCIMEKE